MVTLSLHLTKDVILVILVIQWQHVGELVVLVHQVQAFRDNRMIFEAVLPDGKHHLDHVLDPFVDGRFVEDIPETLKYGCKKERIVFFFYICKVLSRDVEIIYLYIYICCTTAQRKEFNY